MSTYRANFFKWQEIVKKKGLFFFKVQSVTKQKKVNVIWTQGALCLRYEIALKR